MSIQSFSKDFKELPKNARVNIAVLPLWTIPFNLINSYASLYMINQGITASKVGLINSLTFILKTIFALFAGYIINKFGRRKSLAILDIIGWAIPMLIYFFARSYWQFVLAALINCVTIINGIASQLFIVEDVKNEQRIKAFNYMGMVTSFSMLFVPVTGFLINKYSLVPAIRMLYLFAFSSMFLAAILKLIFLKETRIGKKMMKESNLSINPFLNLPRQFRFLIGNSKLIMLFSLNILLRFTMTINNLYYFPFLTKSLNFSESIVSFFPFITTLISLCIYFFVVPNILDMEKNLFISVSMYVLGTLALIVSSFTLKELSFLCVLLWAIAGAIMNPVLNSMTANTIEDEMRTELLGFINMISMLFMFPAGFFGGWLFDISPIYPIIFIFFVYLFSFFMFFLFNKRYKSKQNIS